MCNTSRASQNAAEDARAAEAERQARTQAAIGRINETFGQFDDGFFGQREQAYNRFAMPQLDDQFTRARDDLTFALARSGLVNSSVAGQRLSDLERDYAMRRTEVADRARDVSRQARGEVEAARGNLIAQAQGTGDAQLAGNLAVNEAGRLAAMPSFSPLGALFANVGSGIGVARNVAEAEDVRRQTQQPTLWQNPQGSARVVR